MPIYEYRCQACGRKSTFILLSINSPFEPVCRYCGSRELKRLVSRVAVLRSEESRLERLTDPAILSGVEENDPASLARWMKKFGREMGMGEELGPEFDQEIEQAIEEAERSRNQKESENSEAEDSTSASEENDLPSGNSTVDSDFGGSEEI
ncbi:MAG: zinc ribbon domain-containing protein [Candidatus Aminicenantes bacterium]|nr:zinc ribbon domain-containing protein [Candidatus Aminicenantes bacterium]